MNAAKVLPALLKLHKRMNLTLFEIVYFEEFNLTNTMVTMTMKIYFDY